MDNMDKGALGVLIEIGGILGDLLCTAKDSLVNFIKDIFKAGGHHKKKAFRFIQRTKKVDLKHLAGQLWDKIKEKYQSITNVFKAFFHSELFLTFQGFFKCVISSLSAAEQITRAAVGFVTKITGLISSIALGGIGIIVPLAGIVVDLFCNRAKLTKALVQFRLAFNEQNKPQKWNHYGQFLGLLALAIGP